MPNRYVREGIIESEAVNSLNWQAEVFYRRLINRVDDFGRYTAHPALLRASLFPLQLERVRETDIPRLLQECEQAGLLFVYTASGKSFLALNKWEKGRSSASQYPEPPLQTAAKLDRKEYLGSGVHMGSKMGGVGHMGTVVPKRVTPVPKMGTAALDSDSDSDPDSAPVRPPRALEVSVYDQPTELPPGFPKSIEEAKAQSASIGCKEDFVEKIWNKAVSRGGNDAKGIPIRNWRAYLASEKTFEQERKQSQKNTSATHSSNSQHNTDRSKGTLNEGKASQYAGIGKL